jgi:hypothetical protein
LLLALGRKKPGSVGHFVPSKAMANGGTAGWKIDYCEM